MASYTISSYHIGAALCEEGLVPPECFNVELRMPANGVMTLHYDVNVRVEDVPKIVRALCRYAKEHE